MLEALVRSRLTYALQTSMLNYNENRRISSIWHGFLRKLIRGGYARKKSIDGQESWALKYSNSDVRRICKTPDITEFCEKQYLKFVAHTTRRRNDSLQKVTLFGTPKKYQKCLWKRMAAKTGLDPIQLRKTMFDRDSFNKWISARYSD